MMKKYSIGCVVVVVAAYGADAWTVPHHQHGVAKKEGSLYATTSGKEGQQHSAGWIAAAAFAGFTLATTPIASALVPPVANLPGKGAFCRSVCM